MLKSNNQKAEDSPIEDDSNLNALLQSMVEGMILQDSGGRIIQFNQAALEILGMDQKQLHKPKDEAAPQSLESKEEVEADLEEWDKIFPGKNHVGMNTLKTGKIQHNLVLKIFRYDGEVRWISLNAAPIISKKTGLPHQVLSTFTDITEMRRVLNELKQVQILFNISQDIIIIANQEGYFRRINPRFVDTLGYFQQEVMSKKIIDFVHSEDLKLTEAELKKLQEKKNPVHFINRLRTKSGKYRIFDWIVVPDSETNLTYFTARDLTDYKEEELELIHSSRVYSVGEMASGLAYLITGQVSIINGHLSFLNDQLSKTQFDPVELKKKVASIEESIKKLSKTTKELSSFSQTDINEKVADISLTTLIDTALELCRECFRVHGVKLKVDVEKGITIHCKESQVAHALITLINNSYNRVHSARDGWVKVEGFQKNGKVHIIISDSCKNNIEKAPFNISKAIIEENFGTFYHDRSAPYTKLVIEFPQVKNINQMNT